MHGYRADIDGLRAIAVVAVVLFHANAPGFSGGFVGVDIFFVISGFLITNILMKDVGTGRFRIIRFYERRIRRIVPALTVVLATSTIASLVFCSPTELIAFAKSLFVTTLFSSNLYFSRHLNYFTPTFENPLLHLWSLGVEEQFYVVFPLFLSLLSWRSRRFLMPVLAVIFLISLLTSEWLAWQHPRLAFYFTGSRAWELVLGAIVALQPPCRTLTRVSGELPSGLAVVLLVGPICFFDRSTVWPGAHALLPCLGTAILLGSSNEQKTIVTRVLSARPIVGTGLISYSLYLWHWPLFEFYRRWILRTPSPLEYGALIALALLAASLSWRFVERPFRRKDSSFDTSAVFEGAVASGLAFLLVCAAIMVGHGFPERFSPAIRKIYATLETRFSVGDPPTSNANSCFVASEEARYPSNECFVLADNQPNVVLWGDSMARSLVLGLRAAAQRSNIHLIQANYFSCRPILADQGNIPGCNAFNQAIFARLDRRITAVILSGHFLGEDRRLPALQKVAKEISLKGIRVVILGPLPQYQDSVPFYLVRNLESGDDRLLDSRVSMNPSVGPFDQKMRGLLKGQSGVTYISVLHAVCSADRCPMVTNGAPVQFDLIHMTTEGSLLFGARLWPLIHKAIMAPAANSPARDP